MNSLINADLATDTVLLFLILNWWETWELDKHRITVFNWDYHLYAWVIIETRISGANDSSCKRYFIPVWKSFYLRLIIHPENLLHIHYYLSDYVSLRSNVEEFMEFREKKIHRYSFSLKVQTTLLRSSLTIYQFFSKMVLILEVYFLTNIFLSVVRFLYSIS